MFDNLAAVVEAHARDFPTRDAVIFVRRDGTQLTEESLSYAELDAAARSTAAWLRARYAPGDRALLLYPSGIDFVKSLIGCMYAGITPVPAPLPEGHRHHLARATGIALDADVRVLLTDSGNVERVGEWVAQEGLDDLGCFATDTAEWAQVREWSLPPIEPESLAFLQYTSGSTNDPKGVMVTHRALLDNLARIQQAFGFTPSTRICGWLPTYHDMGLVGLMLEALFLGGTTVQMSPTDFLKRPYLWLKVIDDYRIEATAAPNFAYDLCSRQVTDEQIAALDLSGWRVAINGAEPISAETLRRFTDRFAPTGFRPQALDPCYGMAETTLLISAARHAHEPVLTQVDPRALECNSFEPTATDGPGPFLVSSGRTDDIEVRIVDPDTTETLPEGRIGEVWVRGASVAAGYWRREEETRRTFQAVTAEGAEGFLRTADLGVLHTGELYITGRIKELLIIHGRNLYPHDIEREVLTLHEAFGGLAGSVFSVPTPHEEIVVLQELRPRGGDRPDLPALAREVRGTLGGRLGVRVANVVFLRPGRIRKTTSGKVQRSLMRELFVTDALETLHEDLSAEARLRYRRPAPQAEDLLAAGTRSSDQAVAR